jgi:hypothetical protein
MVILKDILYLTFQDLMQYGYSEDYLKKVCREYRNGVATSYANIPDPQDARRKLIQYTSIPDKAIAERNIPSDSQLRAQLTTANLTQAAQFHAGLRLDQALNYFKANPNTYPHATELAQQSSWLLWLASVKPSYAKSLGFSSVDDLYNEALKQIDELNWKRWKISGLQTLRRKMRPFIALYKKPLNGEYTEAQWQQAIDSLVHKGFGNANREKLGEEQEACIFTLYSNGDAKLTETQVHAMYLSIASRKISAGEWDHNSIISLSTVKNFLNRPDIKQAYWKLRHGKQAYRASFEIITHRKPASIANGLWVIDGTPWHRYYMENGKAYARLNVYVILDAHSWCVVGFFVSEHENSNAVIRALRSACELSGYLPHQIQYDNSSANLSYHAQACMHAIAKHCTPTMVGNARAKVIEPFFKHFNSQVLRFRPGFTHSPVMSNTLNGKPNPDALQKAVKSEGIATSRAQVIRELHEDFAIWNHKPFKGSKSPLEKYKESIASSIELQRPLTQQVLVEGFYQMPGSLKQVKGVDKDGLLRQIQQFFPQEYLYSNDGIEITIEKQKYTFLTDNPEFNSQHLTRKFFVKYDPVELERDGLKSIYLYENSPEGARPFLFNNAHATLKNPNLFSQALIDRTEGEGEALYKHLQNKKLQEKQVDAISDRYTSIAKSTGTFMEIRPENAYPKDILTAAKQQIAEQIINGDQYRITETTQSKPDEVFVPSPGIIDRWAD